MAQFCCLINLLLLLVMMLQTPFIDTRPARGRPQSDLIAGNEFLKLFLERDEMQRDLQSGESTGGRGEGKRAAASLAAAADVEVDHSDLLPGRSTNGRSLEYKVKHGNTNSHQADDDKHVVKLVTTGSKIVFLEEYDDDDAIVDAVAREIDLQKEATNKQQRPKPPDEVKVVAVSVSSSSKRGGPAPQQATLSTTLPSTSSATAASDFINRSHKSEFSIEEAEPLTMLQSKVRRTFAARRAVVNAGDSAHSASTNIQNVLAAPLVAADVAHASAAQSVYRSSNDRNSTSIKQAGNINQTPSAAHASQFDEHDVSDDKLLPFQTVIYHDTKEGNGPQSRSISYSSITQNVENLQAWQQAAGILAEAQRNVSESLKPITRPQTPEQDSEPAKFYSVPSKMYSVPSKFYSEPAKVYSEPAKVYGQPEKFYSEPAKVYSQPSKFYSEPAKVYSQPAKVYGEPAKNYWPNPTTTSTTTTSSTTPAPASSRRPAIVSRIAFGEAQSTTPPVPTHTEHQLTAAKTTSTFQQNQQQQHHHQHQHQHHYRPHNYQHSHTNSNPLTQPRRILFNLDKLPYDLLNAPEQSAKSLLEPDLSKGTAATAATAAGGSTAFAAVPHRPAICLESAFSATTSQQRQQHSSLSTSQHSNHNTKGLPNRDLVKCVSQFAHSSASSGGGGADYTTESSRHIEDLYTPTPEQNYEIEESVSVMTNGRAHGVQSIGSLALTTTAAPQLVPVPVARGRNSNNYNGGIGIGGNRELSLPLPQYHSNANVNAHEDAVGSNNQGNNNNNNQHNYNNNYDDDEEDVDEDVGAHKSHTGIGVPIGGVGGGGVVGGGSADGDGDDAKVAYVVEGRNYRKYRVEEKTDDGFIVGEYGVVDHNDGNLRGVRYTADSTINRSLIQKALLTFLKLK